MSESEKILKGYFGAVKGKKNPSEYIMLSYSELKLVPKEVFAKHAELVKGKEINIEVVSEYEQSVPNKRTMVEFMLNGVKYMVLMVREARPLSNLDTLTNWINDSGTLGINPFSLKESV